MRDYEVGDFVIFEEAHHAMNQAVIDHEGDIGVVIDINRGASSEKTLVWFLENKTSKKVEEKWDIREDRLSKVEGSFEIRCGMCGTVFESSFDPDCPKCDTRGLLSLNE